MFLIYRETDTEAAQFADRGEEHYLGLFKQLLDNELESTQIRVGPLTIRASLSDGMSESAIVSDQKSDLAVLGRPSTLHSTSASVAEVAMAALLQADPVDYLGMVPK